MKGSDSRPRHPTARIARIADALMLGARRLRLALPREPARASRACELPRVRSAASLSRIVLASPIRVISDSCSPDSPALICLTSIQSIPPEIQNIAIFKIGNASCVTGSDALMCEHHVYGVAISTTATRSRVADSLGRRAERRGAKAGTVTSRSASPAGAAGIASSVSCHAQGGKGRSFAAYGRARRRAGAKLAAGLRARDVPARSLLDPERPRTHDRRGRKCAGSGLRAQVDGRALGARREPGVSPRRPRARRSLPRPRAADASRGSERDCVRPSQRARSKTARPPKRRPRESR